MNNTELKQALSGILALAIVLAEQFKDGIQADDVAPILEKMSNDPLKTLLMEAYNGIDKVPSEASDLNTLELLDLTRVALPEMLKLIKTLKK